MKRLYRSTTNRSFAGILGGLGEYFDVDPTALRVFFVFFVLITGFFPGVLAYLIAIFMIPPDHRSHEKDSSHIHNGTQHHP